MKKQIIAASVLVASLVAVLTSGNSVSANAVGGPRVARDRTVPEDGVHVFRITFRGAETARVMARGDGDIDMFVYDSRGRLVDYDNEDDSIPICIWSVPRTQTYTFGATSVEKARFPGRRIRTCRCPRVQCVSPEGSVWCFHEA